jgi:hypothetical protein
MALELISVTAFICQQIIVDKKDDVISAIRLTDAFYVPNGHPTKIVSFSFLVSIKSASEGTARLGFHVFKPDRTEIALNVGLPNLVTLERKIANAPCGHTLNIDFNIKAESWGTHTIEVELDNAVVARTPFTLLQK